MQSPASRLSTTVAFTAVLALGLSAGAMLTEAAVLAPSWRSSSVEDFLGWFGSNEPRLVAFYGPLEIASALLAIAAAGLYGFQRRTGGGLLALSAGLSIVVLVLYPLYFEQVNASFVARSIASADVAAELGRWHAWQWLRTALGLGAFAAALLAVREPA